MKIPYSCSLWALVPAAVLALSAADPTGLNPVGKVVALLTEMRTQVEKEAKDDQQAYDKYACWCGTNKGAKTQAVADAEKKIAELESFIQEAAGLEGQLKTEIEDLEHGIAEDQDALAAATAMREKEQAAFQAAEKETMETLAALKDAVDVLSKVQLLQRRKAHPQEVQPLLLQLQGKMRNIHARLAGFQGVLQKDLWDVMSSLDEVVGTHGGGSFSALEQRGRLRAGQPTGAAAGASSYSARSGGIFGILSEMKDEFSHDLAADQRKDLEALVSYQSLRALKLSEITAAEESRKSKESKLAETLQKAAEAKDDLENTKAALSADQAFLVNLEQNCKANDEDYAARSKVRSEELVALSETLKILTQDEARDLFGRGLSFMQLRATSSQRGAVVHRGSRAATGAAADAVRRRSVVKRILAIARKHHNWHLALLAVHAQLDAFEKVKEVMDKMTAELKAQQKAEVEKKDLCVSEIDKLEDDLKVNAQQHADLEATKLGHENAIATLKQDISNLQTEVADLKVSLKQAGENRKAENLLFQESVADQRAIMNVLEKAKKRLQMFYASNATLAQVRGGQPGQPVAPPPPKPQEYKKSGGAGGVLQLLDHIVASAGREEAELVTEEQHAQTTYALLAKSITDAVEADSTSISQKSSILADEEAALAYTNGDLMAKAEEGTSLNDALHGAHVDCDYLLKYFDIRQQARQEELDAIAQAKAVLSGADFGTEATAASA